VTTTLTATVPESAPQPFASRFGVHLGGLQYEKAAPLIKGLGDIYVREELFEDSGWRHIKADNLTVSSALCREYCVETEYTDCSCQEGIYYADKHPDKNYAAGISFYENNFNLLVTILNYTNSKTEPPIFETTYKIKKEAVYKQYLDYLLTGLPRVKYWQIANEVDLPFWAGTPDDYLEMVKVSYPYIKKYIPDARVGVSFNTSFNNLSQDWIRILKILGKNCDFIDAHLLPIDGMDMRKLKAMDLSGWKALCPNAELISTETGLPDQKLHPDWGVWGLGGTREKQATDLLKYCTMLFDKGYSKIFLFLSDFDFEAIADDLFEHTGLTTRDGEPKPSYTAYKNLISKVDGFTSLTKLNEGQYKYEFSNRAPVYVLWNDGNHGFPPEINGTIKVTNYQGIEKTMNTADLILGDAPVFVEMPN